MASISTKAKLHYIKFAYRATLLLVAAGLFVFNRPSLDFTATPSPSFGFGFLLLVWLTFAAEAVLRLIPNKRISMGARKHFASTFVSSGRTPAPGAKKRLNKGIAKSGLLWLGTTVGILLGLHVFGLLTPAAVLCVMLVYGVMDQGFVIFTCPLREMFMKNRCCSVCRIYNWGNLMMCAPVILFPSAFSLSLVLLSAAVLLRWEVAFYCNSKYFMKEANRSLQCDMCEERLCHKAEFNAKQRAF